MKVRGRRECLDCGTVWSYYETASPQCPECESLRSRGLDEERTRHTDDDVTFDLTPVRAQVDDLAPPELGRTAAENAREYVRKRGFIHAGDLRVLDWTYVGAVELAHVGRAFAHEMRPTTDAEEYLLTLLADADGGQVREPEAVPAEFANAYGLAMADAVGDYLRDLRTFLEDSDGEWGETRRLAGRVRDHAKRIEALDGAVDPEDAHRLVRATRDLGRTIADEDESALVTADNWLDGIED